MLAARDVHRRLAVHNPTGLLATRLKLALRVFGLR